MYRKSTRPPVQDPSVDVFGFALQDYLDGASDAPFQIHRDDGLIVEDDPGRYFDTEPWPHEVPALAHVSGRVLDVGCGAGRHLLWLKREGFEAVGIDASEIAVEICKRRGCANVFKTDIMSDTRDPGLPPFDTITLFGNNVGIAGTFGGACDLFRGLAGWGTPASRLIVTGIDIRATDNPVHLAYHIRNIEAGRRRGEIEMRFAYKDRIGPWIPWFHPEPCEVEEIADASGWCIEHADVLESGFFWTVLMRQV